MFINQKDLESMLGVDNKIINDIINNTINDPINDMINDINDDNINDLFSLPDNDD